MEHPDFERKRIAQRHERLLHEADAWRLVHQESQRGLLSRARGLLHSSGRALVRLGRRLAAYGAAQTALSARK
jgi:hypothetical protein